MPEGGRSQLGTLMGVGPGLLNFGQLRQAKVQLRGISLLGGWVHRGWEHPAFHGASWCWRLLADHLGRVRSACLAAFTGSEGVRLSIARCLVASSPPTT